MRIVWPGPGRITLAALAIVPAAMAYPWHTVTQRWVLGIAVALTIILFGWWRGLHFTTIVRRRLALLFGRGDGTGGAHQLVEHTGADARTTAVLRVLSESEGDLPLDVIASYLDRYGVRCESVRITSRDSAGGRSTWIGLTMSAAANLTALQARSSRIPLRDTAEIALRRLADHLREFGWAISTSDLELPDLLGPDAKERWLSIEDGSKGHVAAYAIRVDDKLADTLAELWSADEPEVWTSIALLPGDRVSAACAIRSAEAPGSAAPLSNLIAARGHQLSGLVAIAPDATEPLEAPAGSAVVLNEVRWPTDRGAGVRT